jgi:DNA primase
MRCVYCGDSQSNKSKARGYLFPKEGKVIYKCHNCGKGASLNNFIKEINPQLHKEYSLERFSDGKSKRSLSTGKTKSIKRFSNRPRYLKTPLGKLKKISQLALDHPARKYVEKRLIPTDKHFKLFYAPKFYAFAEQFGYKFDIKGDEPRLIIPFINGNGELMGFQGRAFGKTSLRYITIKVDEDAPKIFGIDSIDRSKPVYVVEGPIDSMFLDNCVAMGGADLTEASLKYVGTKDLVFVFDNEPRNKEILSRIEKIIDMGYNISLFPESIEQKDINDMVLSGIDPVELQVLISRNTVSGLAAKAKLSEWRKA